MKNVLIGNGVAVLVAALVLGAQGGETQAANWQPTAGGTFNWSDLANWDVDFVPTNATDTARFDAAAITGEQRIMLPSNLSGTYWTLGTVFGHPAQTIYSHGRHSNGTAARRIAVTDPSGFLGTWANADARCIWTSPASPEFVPVFHQVDVSRRPLFEVNSDRVEIGLVKAGGGILKTGNGSST